MYRSSLGHRIAGIDRKIEDRELELIAVDMCGCQVFFRNYSESNLRAQGPPEHVLHPAYQGEDIERLRIKALLSGEGEKALDEGRA